MNSNQNDMRRSWNKNANEFTFNESMALKMNLNKKKSRLCWLQQGFLLVIVKKMNWKQTCIHEKNELEWIKLSITIELLCIFLIAFAHIVVIACY